MTGTIAHADQLKGVVAPFIAAAQSFAEGPVRRALDDVAATEICIRMCHPFGDLQGTMTLFDTVYAPLIPKCTGVKCSDSGDSTNTRRSVDTKVQRQWRLN